jgi:hypothetical protein
LLILSTPTSILTAHTHIGQRGLQGGRLPRCDRPLYACAASRRQRQHLRTQPCGRILEVRQVRRLLCAPHARADPRRPGTKMRSATATACSPRSRRTLRRAFVGRRRARGVIASTGRAKVSSTALSVNPANGCSDRLSAGPRARSRKRRSEGRTCARRWGPREAQARAAHGA